MSTDESISPLELQARLAIWPPPTLVDVRRAAAFAANPVQIPGSLRILPEALAAAIPALDDWRPVVAYCVHGHEVSRNAATLLRAAGFDAVVVAGGLEDWSKAGLPVKPYTAPTQWVTRERPKIDRLACPWLIRRFIDPSAEIVYLPNAAVRDYATTHNAIPFDVPDVAYTHVGDQCSFDAFIRLHGLDDPALAQLATIVRGADTNRLDLAPQAAGLLATALGLSRVISDDQQLLRHSLLLYDALYAWCGSVGSESHDWNPAALRIPPAA